MPTEELTPHFPWDAPGWLGAVSEWIEARLAGRGSKLDGPVELVHTRPWSAFAKAPTAEGVVYFKTTSPYLRHEIPLTRMLAELAPEVIPPIIDRDEERGWLLTEDAGVTLRSLGQTPAQLACWDLLLPVYASLQQQVAAHTGAMLLAGVPDHRLASLPGLYEALLDDSPALRVGLDGGLPHDQHEALRQLAPQVAEMCHRLAGFGIPETIAHEEVTEVNVLARGDGFTFIDWSDCSVSHPFMSLLVSIRSVAHWLKLDERGPEIAHLRDVYLGAWAGYAGLDELRRAADIAMRVGMICRALSYHRWLGRLPEQYRAENDSIHGWLQDFLEAEMLAAGG